MNDRTVDRRHTVKRMNGDKTRVEFEKDHTDVRRYQPIETADEEEQHEVVEYLKSGYCAAGCFAICRFGGNIETYQTRFNSFNTKLQPGPPPL